MKSSLALVRTTSTRSPARTSRTAPPKQSFPVEECCDTRTESHRLPRMVRRVMELMEKQGEIMITTKRLAEKLQVSHGALLIHTAQVSQLLKVAGPKNVTFHINDQPFQIVDIEGWRFKMGHGDHLKGSDKAVGVPAHSIGREINATVQRYAARGEKVPDFYLMGDKHRHM